MPIRKSSTAAGPRGGRQSALKLFTDRDQERELLRNFFERLADRRSRPKKPILSLWGIGGIGKTSLLKKASEELDQDLAGLVRTTDGPRRAICRALWLRVSGAQQEPLG
jgi:hypothetical protein